MEPASFTLTTSSGLCFTSRFKDDAASIDTGCINSNAGAARFVLATMGIMQGDQSCMAHTSRENACDFFARCLSGRAGGISLICQEAAESLICRETLLTRAVCGSLFTHLREGQLAWVLTMLGEPQRVGLRIDSESHISISIPPDGAGTVAIPQLAYKVRPDALRMRSLL